ncbi:MAG: histidine phosphatase family protein [Myxococcota bacterium]
MSIELVLIRHGETAWNLTGQHTGRTDLPLTPRGEAMGRALAERLSIYNFDRVWVSPLRRAQQTAELAGCLGGAEIVEDLAEWDYGQVEGRTKAEMRVERPSWDIWTDGAPGGEQPHDVIQRATRLVARLRRTEGCTGIFSHGHFLRVLACAWLDWPLSSARSMTLQNMAISVLRSGDEGPELIGWNLTR